MRVVYLAAPLGAATDEAVRANVDRALRWYRWACDTQPDCAFVMNWIVDVMTYPNADVGDDRHGDADRQRGLVRDDAVIRACDEYWMIAGRVSDGMRRGSYTARSAGVSLVDLTILGSEPPEVTFTVAAPTNLNSLVGEVSRIDRAL